jgi:GNAT superfamily N-acetyltransferase
VIKTRVDPLDEKALLELGYRFHQESQYRDTPFNSNGILSLIQLPSLVPDKCFIAFDDEYKGVIILQMGTQFFSGQKWAGDQVFYVDPSHRGSSLAMELLEVGYQWAKENGAKDMVIFHNAGIGLESAKKFYNRNGFDLSGLIFNKRIN